MLLEILTDHHKTSIPLDAPWSVQKKYASVLGEQFIKELAEKNIALDASYANLGPLLDELIKQRQEIIDYNYNWIRKSNPTDKALLETLNQNCILMKKWMSLLEGLWKHIS